MTATRIDNAFSRLKQEGRKGFIAYITAGDPSLSSTEDTVLRLEDAGVDLVELGIPFSDPLADGRVNQMSATRALAAGTTPEGVLETISRIRSRSEIPLLCYTYMNPMLAHGFSNTVRKAARAGMDGLLLLDLPCEEMGDYAPVLAKEGVNNICLVTPTSPMERIRRITVLSTGFVYCVSREGVTGMQARLQAGADSLVENIRKTTSLPVALGFGVSSPQMAREAARLADAVVVGSAIVNRFAEEGDSTAGRKRAAGWVATLVKAVKEA